MQLFEAFIFSSRKKELGIVIDLTFQKSNKFFYKSETFFWRLLRVTLIDVPVYMAIKLQNDIKAAFEFKSKFNKNKIFCLARNTLHFYITPSYKPTLHLNSHVKRSYLFAQIYMFAFLFRHKRNIF